MKYWVSVVSRDHVLAGLEGRFIQATHDKAATLHALQKGDVIFSYSPGTLFRAGTILQAFTGVARVADEEAHAAEISARAIPWRRTIAPLTCDEAPIAPLVPVLDFIQDKANWEMALRRGIFEIGEDDARRIAAAMHADLAS